MSVRCVLLPRSLPAGHGCVRHVQLRRLRGALSGGLRRLAPLVPSLLPAGAAAVQGRRVPTERVSGAGADRRAVGERRGVAKAAAVARHRVPRPHDHHPAAVHGRVHLPQVPAARPSRGAAVARVVRHGDAGGGARQLPLSQGRRHRAHVRERQLSRRPAPLHAHVVVVQRAVSVDATRGRRDRPRARECGACAVRSAGVHWPQHQEAVLQSAAQHDVCARVGGGVLLRPVRHVHP